MDNSARHDEHGDIGPDPAMDLGDVERVEAAPGYHAELSVPFTSEQLAALERVARERGIGPAQAAQRLVAEALAVREHGW